MKHINIPIFIPHLGCPNQCIFCNQRFISGHIEFSELDVERQILEVLSTTGEKKVEIAFFGGSFTGIDRSLMVRLLDLAQKYVNDGRVCAIRMSTRPDYIDGEVISILKKYTVSCVELGVQTVNDEILTYLKRGHSVKDTKNAILLLKKHGIPFVGQMMIGLPKATIEDEIECAKFICEQGAVGSRIYPTIVFKQTELEKITELNEYKPLSFEEAVDRSASVLDIFVKNGVPCIRIGLCDSENLHSDDTFVAGPNHPSLGEMIKSRLYFNKICDILNTNKFSNNIIIFCPKGVVSQVVGNSKSNILKIQEIYGFKSIKVYEDDSLKSYDINIKSKED